MNSPAENADMFVIAKEDDTYYLYMPLQRRVALVNRATLNAVARFTKSGACALNEAELQTIETLREQGFFPEAPASQPVFPASYDFCPHEVTLFLTSRCNLRCRYCYANAGEKCVDMPWDMAQAAIDLVAGNAGVLGSPKFAVGFHGGGEPTVAWDVLERAVEYSEAKADALGLDAEIFAATNGLLSSVKRSYIVEHFSTVNVSLDGPADIQDLNRPKANGKGSYQDVCETLRYFDECGFHYGVRATITSATVHRMEEIVECLCDEHRLAYLHLEPVWACGRCTLTGEQPPSDAVFVENFLKARQRGQALGIEVHYSGARLDMLTNKFCGAPGDGFTVLPEGIVTSCYEITDPDDPRAEIFHYGRYSHDRAVFQFDRQKITALQKLSVEHIPFCKDCFCKWHCAGDCLAKVFRASGAAVHEGSSRCGLNRSLTLASLDAVIEGVQDGEARRQIESVNNAG